MELKEALLKRRSVRKFTNEPVTDEEIDIILHMATCGPSAMNKKPWEFYVISDREKLEKLRNAGPYKGYESPIAMVVAGNLQNALPSEMSEYWVQDCSAATENILLTAVDLGLGAVWCGVHPIKSTVKKVQEVLELPKHIVPLNIIYIGHSALEVESRDQYEEEKVHKD